VTEPVSCTGKKKTDMWGPPVSGCAMAQCTDSVQRGKRAGPALAAGPKRRPRPFLLFLFLFLFLFVFFSFVFIFFCKLDSNQIKQVSKLF
jgi:hypothetical protein